MLRKFTNCNTAPKYFGDSVVTLELQTVRLLNLRFIWNHFISVYLCLCALIVGIVAAGIAKVFVKQKAVLLKSSICYLSRSTDGGHVIVGIKLDQPILVLPIGPWESGVEECLASPDWLPRTDRQHRFAYSGRILLNIPNNNSTSVWTISGKTVSIA